MKYGFRDLIIWYLIFYFFIGGALRDIFIWGETDSLEFDSIFAFTSLFIFFIYVFASYTVLYKFYPERKWFHCIVGILLAAVFTIAFRFLVEQMITPHLFDEMNYRKDYGLRNYFIDNYFFGVRYVTFAIVYYLIRYTMFKQGREKDLILEKQKLEIESLNAQINPHFLLNSINNIYSLVYHKSDMALNAIDKLSEILKYNLYEKNDFVSVKKELEIVHQFIELQSLRHEYDISIDIQSSIDSGTKIPQLLILPIVENAFKHGVLNEIENCVYLTLDKIGDDIHIKSGNKKSKHKLKDNTGGIGLKNISDRLNLLYQNKASIDIKDGIDYFSIHITIPYFD